MVHFPKKYGSIFIRKITKRWGSGVGGGLANHHTFLHSFFFKPSLSGLFWGLCGYDNANGSPPRPKGMFSAVQNSSIGDLVTNSLTDWLSDFWFWQFRVILETCNLWDIWWEWWGDMTWTKKWQLQIQRPWQTHLWNCWHFRQLRTWIHDNHYDLTIKSDTRQHSEFAML